MLKVFNFYQRSKPHVESKSRTFLLAKFFLGFERNCLARWLPIVYITR
jgi:hypothetical protein